MGALDRIVSAGKSSDESGQGRSAPGAEGTVLAPKTTGAEAAAAAPVEDTPGESAPADLGAPREAGELANKTRDERQAPAALGDRNGERPARADRRLHDETPDERGPERTRRETMPRPQEAYAPRDPKGLRSVEDTSKPKAAAQPPPPARAAAESTQVPQRAPVEIRREHIVRERVVERTLVERLVVPERAPATAEPRTPLPSIVRAPERAESEPKRQPPPREGEHTKNEQPEPRPSTLARAPERAQAPEVDRDRAERREPHPGPAPQRDALRETSARPSSAQRNADDRRATERRDERVARDRRDDEKGRAAGTAQRRPIAALVTPRPPKPPAAPAQAPKRDAAPRRGQTSNERLEPQPPARPTSPPRIQISIGRVEVRGKSAEPTVQRGPVASPRSHQIDPGLGFGPLDGGRF